MAKRLDPSDPRVCCDGAVILYEQSGSKKWWYRYKLDDGTWKRASTGKEDLDEAKTFAVNSFEETKKRAEALKTLGMDPEDDKNKDATFSDLVREQVAKWVAAKDTAAWKAIYKTYISTARKYTIPFFDSILVSKATENVMLEYEEYVARQVGPGISKSTYGTHHSMLRQVFELSISKGLCKRSDMPRFTKKNKGRKVENRPTFTIEEWRYLLLFMDHVYIEDTDRFSTRYKRGLLREYMNFIAKTGCRPGTETDELRWKHINENYVPNEVQSEERSENIANHVFALRKKHGLESFDLDEDDRLERDNAMELATETNEETDSASPEDMAAEAKFRSQLRALPQNQQAIVAKDLNMDLDQLQVILGGDPKVVWMQTASTAELLHKRLSSYSKPESPTKEDSKPSPSLIIKIDIVQGKRGARTCFARESMRPSLQRIRELTKCTAPDDYVFAMPDGSKVKGLSSMFTEMLKKAELQKAPNGKNRTLYSLRHMYATFAIQYKRLPTEVLRKQMGTSSLMLEHFYDQSSLDEFAPELAD